jgi:hypothetical protein
MPRLLSLYEDCRAITRWGAACTKALEEGRPLLEPYSEPYDGLSIYSVSIIDSHGNSIPEPVAGQAFKMSINIINSGGANAPASTLTVEMTPSDNSPSQSFSASVPLLHRGKGAVVSISVPALTAGLTYDFNFYDPSTTLIGYESFQL